MFALEMTLLTGCYAATAHNDRSFAEWPPHPARLFSALVATHHAEPCVDPAERKALEWLEAQGAPSIVASEAAARDIVTVFVPVNDTTVLGDLGQPQAKLDDARTELGKAREALRAYTASGHDEKRVKQLEKAVARAEKQHVEAEVTVTELWTKTTAVKARASEGDIDTATKLFPERRGRQPRTFPSVAPDDPIVQFLWPMAEPSGEIYACLQRLCERVVRVGHSASLVRLRVADTIRSPDWEPDEVGAIHLRVPLPGQLQRLEQQFNLHQETRPRVLPAFPQGYRRPTSQSEGERVRTLFEDEWIVLRLASGDHRGCGQRPALPIMACVGVAEAVRGALLHHAEQPYTEVLSGHLPDGAPSHHPHLAIVPLPWVGGPHADGHLLGVALILPRGVRKDQRLALYRALANWEDAARGLDSEEDCPALSLMLGRAGVWNLRRLDDLSHLNTLRSTTWCRPRSGEKVWMSATPVALDRNPGDLLSRHPEKAAKAFAEAEQTIAAACNRIGLPAPEQVWVTRSAPLAGSEKAKRFPRFPQATSKAQRVLVHATLLFGQAVVGPVILGAGRYRGLGLFRPVSAELIGQPRAQHAAPMPPGEIWP